MLGGESFGLLIRLSPAVVQTLQEHVTHLLSLELHSCQLLIPEGSITCLKTLTSLKITASWVGIDLHELTTLTSLDLSSCYGKLLPYGSHDQGTMPWKKFEAWPALQVFKFAHCCLVDSTTELSVATVNELHTDRLAVGMEGAAVHLKHDSSMVGRHALPEMFASILSPSWCSCILDVRIKMTGREQNEAYIAAAVAMVFLMCTGLQTFHLTSSAAENQGQARIVVGQGCCGQLTELKLVSLYCQEVDLRSATRLSSITLAHTDLHAYPDGTPFKLALPESVQQLRFFWQSSFYATSQAQSSDACQFDSADTRGRTDLLSRYT